MSEVATARFRTLDASNAISNGTVVPFYLDDRRLRIAIARVDGRLYAFDDLCTCTDEHCPLSGGLLTETAIMCQCHGTRFDIATGAPIARLATTPLATYETREIDDTIQVRA